MGRHRARGQRARRLRRGQREHRRAEAGRHRRIPAGHGGTNFSAESTKPVVGPVVERLDKRRAAARRQLRAARLPAGQKAVANDLAEIYGDARRSILRAPGNVGSEDRPLATCGASSARTAGSPPRRGEGPGLGDARPPKC
jgi:hypothetical protein